MGGGGGVHMVMGGGCGGGGGEACRLPALQGNQFKVIRGDSHHHTRELGRLSRITQTPVDLEEGDGFIVEVTIQNYI